MPEARLELTFFDASLHSAARQSVPADLPKTKSTVAPGADNTLYQILVDTGVLQMPASVLAGMIGAWLYSAWERSGRPKDSEVGLSDGSGASHLVTVGPTEADTVEAVSTALGNPD